MSGLNPTAWIPVVRPQLPTAEELLPYLQRIDAARYYSNQGPLSRQLEERLAERYASPARGVTLSSSATSGITAALLAMELPSGSLCAVPSWTFVATAQAVLSAGLIPWLVDVNPRSQALEPSQLRAALPSAPGEVRAAVFVEPFGQPAVLDEWERLRERTGIVLVRDAAASFDSVRFSSIPTVVSMHATKVLGVGEGGFVVWDDARIEIVRERLDFGFRDAGRRAFSVGINGKLSEYAAAVGLAGLDHWATTRAEFADVAAAYINGFAGTDVLLQPGYGEKWITSTVVVQLPWAASQAVETALGRQDVGSLRWWGGGLPSHPALNTCPRTPTPVTQDLAAQSLGLPCWRGLGARTIARVAEVVLRAISEGEGSTPLAAAAGS